MLLTLILLAMVGIFCFAGVSCSNGTPAHANTGTQVTRQNISPLTREQIRDSLKTLESSEMPMSTIGAMCYVPRPVLDRAEYICPKCGGKTLYSQNNASFVEWDIESCRREFKRLKSETKLAFTLDESSYCAHCSPKAGEHQLVLTVKYPDGLSHSSAPISANDLRILRYFLKGELSYKTSNDGTSPLKNELPRLRQLLGVSTKQKTEGK